MKNQILKTTVLAVLTAAMAGMPGLLRADDTNAAASSATAPAASDQPGPSKFYGPMTAVDTNAMTFTVGDQTFTVTGESQMTKDGKSATLADAVVGEPARGSYVKSSDGKLDVTKVRFGKKTGGKAGGKSGGKKKKTETEGSTDTNSAVATPPNQ